MVSPIAFGDFQFDPATGDLHGSSGLVQLTPKALEFLGYLTSHAGRLVTKPELLDALSPHAFLTDGVLKVCVRELRRALDDDARTPRFIETAHRRGYRFIAPIQPVDTSAAGGGDGGRVQYARSGDVNIAYQVLGSGPIDLVFVMGW